MDWTRFANPERGPFHVVERDDRHLVQTLSLLGTYPSRAEAEDAVRRMTPPDSPHKYRVVLSQDEYDREWPG